MLKNSLDNLLEYFAAINILKILYAEWIISFWLFVRISRDIAAPLKAEPLTDFSHIRQSHNNTVTGSLQASMPMKE